MCLVDMLNMKNMSEVKLIIIVKMFSSLSSSHKDGHIKNAFLHLFSIHTHCCFITSQTTAAHSPAYEQPRRNRYRNEILYFFILKKHHRKNESEADPMAFYGLSSTLLLLLLLSGNICECIVIARGYDENKMSSCKLVGQLLISLKKHAALENVLVSQENFSLFESFGEKSSDY
jgi:hypothetical protein